MRACDNPLLKSFWYCVARSGDVLDKPFGTRLLGHPVALWRDAHGEVRAVHDRCPHRTARLSLGQVENGDLVCPYHGWTFNGDGHCIRVPQRVDDRPTPFGVAAYRCAERYGYVWVALEEPRFEIPDIPELSTAGWRQVHEFHEVWHTSALRIIENAFDPAHISYVHRNTFGSADPRIEPFAIEEMHDGFLFHNEFRVMNAEHMKSALAMDDDETTRATRNRFHLPFSRVGHIHYPNGLIHILCSFLTPIDDEHTRFTQWVVRNDREEDVPASVVVAFDREVTDEDRQVLESTDPDVPLDRTEGRELHMASDRAGLTMRRMLRELSEAQAARNP